MNFRNAPLFSYNENLMFNKKKMIGFEYFVISYFFNSLFIYLECFPEEHSISRVEYINLLDLPNFGGMPYPLVDGTRPPWRFMADLR